LDEHVRRLHAQVPTITTWDDHEVHNNWYPGQIITDERYQEKRISVLAARAKQAAREYSPMRGESIHRALGFGPLVDVFVLDGRSFRGTQRGSDGSLSMFGREQVRWFCEALERSRAVWKIVVCGTPMGMVIPSGEGIEDGIGNGPGAPLGREKELVTILEFIKARKIHNVAWVSAEVHYASAFHYHPSRARGVDFTPFWQFTAGPLHAGTFGPDEVDETFGPEVNYRSVAPGALEYQPPTAATQSFGLLQVDGKTAGLRVSLHDGSGLQMWAVDLEAQGIRGS
jgi:alkaline phosphatase D